LKSYENKSPICDQIPTEVIQAGDETLRAKYRKLPNSVRHNKELLGQWMQSIIVPIFKKGDKISPKSLLMRSGL
jgi:hypothetical protein